MDPQSLGARRYEPATERSANLDRLRLLADGTCTYVWRDASHPNASWLVEIESLNESAMLARLSGKEITVIERSASGDISIYTRDGVSINTGSLWTRRPRAGERLIELREIINTNDSQKLELLARALDFAFHVLSPRRTGATLVLDLEGSISLDSGQFLGGSDGMPILASFSNDSSLTPLANLLSSVDGACLVDSSGRVIAVEVMLPSSDDAARFTLPLGGTRHTSALRYSFDKDTAVIMVVSADGPVSVFYGGARIMTLEESPSNSLQITQFSPGQARQFEEVRSTVECVRCSKAFLVTDLVRAGDSPAEQTVPCPVCRAPALLSLGPNYRVRVSPSRT